MRYTFKSIENCNLCHKPSEYFQLLGKRLNQSQGKSPQKIGGISTSVYKCRNCDLIFSNPQPVPFDIQDHYGVPPESYWQPEYFKTDDKYFAGEINWLKKITKEKPQGEALDIGAGLGKCMIALSKAGFNSYGIEPSKPFYEKAIEVMKIDKNRLKLSSVEDADYPENTFNFITFGAVMEHLYDPFANIEKGMKWLKPNGLMHIEVPNSHWMVHRVVNLFYRLKGMDYVANLSPMHKPYHLHEFSLKSFQKNAEILNYEIADHGYYVCQTYLPKILDRPLKSYMKRTNTGMQLVVWLRKK